MAQPQAVGGLTPRAEDGVLTVRSGLRVPAWTRVLWANGKSRVGVCLLAAFVLAAVLAPLLTPYDPQNASFGQSLPPSGAHWMGTTAAGQDVYSQLVYGSRTSLLVGLVSGAIATVIALVFGLTAGYLRGWADELLSGLTNLALVIPALPLMITLAAYAPVRGVWLIVFVISVTGWAYAAKIKRAQIVTLRTRDYITAAKFAGDGSLRIIFREIMPNMTSLVVVGFMGAATGAIGGEAGLEFLGLGDPTTISWGTMLYWANNSGALLTGQWAWLIAPGLALTLLITAMTLINFGVDALSNPALREE